MHFRSILIAFLATIYIANGVHAALTAVNPEQFFIDPERATVLQWSGSDIQTLPYVITDYWGRLILEGEAKSKDEKLTATVTLPQGFYEITFRPDGKKATFGLAVVPAIDRSGIDPYFCVDSALSWLERSEERRRSLIRMMFRMGIALSRERFSWKEINPNENEWNWDGISTVAYDKIRKLYREEHVPILECFHDSPLWMGTNSSYPVNLLTAETQLQEMLSRWSPSWGGLEVWNEPDAAPFSRNRAMDQYAPFLQLMAYLFDKNGIKDPLVGGSFSAFNRVVIDNAWRNGILDNMDALSYHTYASPKDFESVAENVRNSIASSTRPSIPLWITESGSPWSEGTSRPSPDEDRASALSIVGKTSEGRATGIARIFPFVVPFYKEHTKNFGMVGLEGTPLRSLASYAFAIRMLAHREYIGDLTMKNSGPVVLSRVYAAKEADEVVAVLSASAAQRGARFVPDLPLIEARGIDGRAIKSADDGSIPIDDGLVYLVINRQVLTKSGNLNTDTRAMKLYGLAQQPDSGRLPASPIILQFIPDSKRMMLGAEICTINYGNLDRVPFTVRVVNLDPKESKTVTVSLNAGGIGRDQKPVGEERTITLTPNSEQNLPWILDLQDVFRENEKVTVRAEGRDVSSASAREGVVSVDFLAERSLEELLELYGKHLSLQIQDVAKWNTVYVNTEAGGVVEAQPGEGGKTVILDILFKKDGGEDQYWAYPRFPIPQGTNLRGAQGMIVRLRATRPGNVRAFVWKKGGVGYFTPSPLIPPDGDFHAVWIPFSEMWREWSTALDSDPNLVDHLDRVEEIAIGVNTHQGINSIEVSDVFIVWSKEASVAPEN